MTQRLDMVESGQWLSHQRLSVYPLLMIVLTVASTAFMLWHHGGRLPSGAPFGSDFVSYWVAARQALAGNPLVPYERALFEPAQTALFPDAGYFAFFYPPHYLAAMTPFGALPYYPALAVWMAASLAAAVLVTTRITGEWRITALLVLACPATYLTIAHGQNAFLSAALFGGALWLLPRRPVLAGVLFGLLTFKPQLGLMVPLALLAAGQWRAIVAAGATFAVLVVATAGLFGGEVWLAFLGQGTDATTTLTHGIVGWEKMISVYAALRLVGLEDATAMALHLLLAASVAVATIWAWRSDHGIACETRAALLMTAALIATPFGLSYDLFVLAPALAFLARRGLTDGFLPWEKTAMAAVYLAPFALMVLMAAKLPAAPLVLLALFGLLMRRAMVEHRSARSAFPCPAE